MRSPTCLARPALLLALAALTGCYFHDRLKNGRGHEVLVNTQGMEVEYLQNGAMIFRAPNMRNLSEFSEFILDPVTLESYSAGDRSLTEDERQRLCDFFHDAVSSELTTHDYPVVVLPGDHVLAIDLSISGLRPSRENDLSRLVDIDPNIGGVTIQAVFRDSSSARIEAIYMRTVSGATLDEIGHPEDPWADAEAAMRQWAIAFREALDEAHGRVN